MPLSSFRFAHLADCHLDSWREPALKETSLLAFREAIDWCKKERMDFVLISGDIFHSCTPDMDILRAATKKMKELRDAGIPIYAIAGSHDFSQSDKTILSVLDAAGLFTNVARGEEHGDKLSLKFTIDEKTGAKIAGMPGKKGGLEKLYYDSLEKDSLEREDGFKIFMFHSAIEEYKPKFLKDAEGVPLSSFPKGFAYYAGGHVHETSEHDEPKFGRFAFPGALYPANFRELEYNKKGNFFCITVSEGKVNSKRIPLEPRLVTCVRVDASGKSAEACEEAVAGGLSKATLAERIVLLRVFGKLSSGRVGDIDFSRASKIAEDAGALVMKKNAYALEDREFEEVQVDSSLNLAELEAKILREHLGKGGLSVNEEMLARELMACLDTEKQEGETISAFEEKISMAGEKVLGIRDVGDSSDY